MPSLIRPCCLSWFSSSVLMWCWRLAAHSCFCCAATCAQAVKGSGPIRPRSPKVADKSNGPIKPLAITADRPQSPPARKKPQSVLPNASATKAENWRDQKHRFLQSTYDALRNSRDATSMAWTNLHVSGYVNVLPGLTRPRQLAACCLRSSSNETHRWSCWSCQLKTEEAKASGFSLRRAAGSQTPSSSIIGGKRTQNSPTGTGCVKPRGITSLIMS